MHLRSMSAALAAAALLAACNALPVPTAAEAAGFDDNGCLGVLLLQRNAVLEGRALGDEGALRAAIGAWRMSARGYLTADELAQFEASSFAVHDDQTPEIITERAAQCVADAPPN
jgi:hypothetical protein